jgi:hypothetical protein
MEDAERIKRDSLSAAWVAPGRARFPAAAFSLTDVALARIDSLYTTFSWEWQIIFGREQQKGTKITMERRKTVFGMRVPVLDDLWRARCQSARGLAHSRTFRGEENDGTQDDYDQDYDLKNGAVLRREGLARQQSGFLKNSAA